MVPDSKAVGASGKAGTSSKRRSTLFEDDIGEHIKNKHLCQLNKFGNFAVWLTHFVGETLGVKRAGDRVLWRGVRRFSGVLNLSLEGIK